MLNKFTQSLVFLTTLALIIGLFVPVQTADAVTVGPSKIEAEVDPGDTVEGEFFLKNEDGGQQTFYSSVQKFTEQGSIKSFLDEPTLLSEWVDVPESVTLESGADQRFPFTIDIPDDAPPGGHFGVIWWSPTPPNATSSRQVSITTRAGALVYINVSGDVQQTASIERFSVDKKVTKELPIEFSLDIKNTGTVYIQPSGSIEISSVLGNARASLPINEKNLQILPGSTKSISIPFSDEAWFWGPYKAEVSLRYGTEEDGQFKVLNESKTFWVFGVASTAIILLAILFLLFGLPYMIRRYNKWIIEKSRE